MTLNEFLEKLPPDGWYLRSDETHDMEIERTDSPGICPWLYVYYQCRPLDPEFSVDGGGLKIWKAADNSEGHDPALRARLLAKCGLREEGGTSK